MYSFELGTLNFAPSNGGVSCAAGEHLLQGIFFRGHLAEFCYVPNSVVVEVTWSLKYRCVVSVSDPKEGLSPAPAKKRESNFFLSFSCSEILL